MLYLGCPQWGSAHWKGRFLTRDCTNTQMLGQYAQIFNSVEGNTSFYADPSPETIVRWQQSIPSDFKFTFKIPKRISHQAALLNVTDDFKQWCQLFSPLFPYIGSVMLQLPKAFSPQHLSRLADFLTLFPAQLPCSVEVRNLGFFNKDKHEIALNQLLIKHNVDRVMMDTRPLFSEAPTTEAIIDAQNKKPKVPLHVISTGNSPIIRFVGCSDLPNNRAFYNPWLGKIRQWLSEGKTPYVFFHTADNHDSPLLARQFMQDLGLDHPVLQPFLAEKESKQNTLF
ncbi:DUF72 domain-containing protein [Pseudoalteromonas tunicata]|uniref:DUF72 domain-containing protein n=1 Tax=Pseudoalteromonas tunicata D2 TaxID=87626 RepID=A4CFI7_9GAMM|nr:DUF72 domain-containing protein [Pseudoalteromonas tunicata]ATC95197.1 hypothetical protein PTUN_a2767 [Pseudoalteromonas tunicata]AXT30807.1 DUF72 domain-containing protein [Pseudoalteromonas tunicata]EAR26525.1 hypothetical protein PTD2_22627 [Pseudoalteromonas tunicata D2]